MSQIRPAAVAGAFYPGNGPSLNQAIDVLLAETPAESARTPKAVIVPHAGYVYSGAVAARAYRRLERARGMVSRVVLLGPAHRVPVRGLALPEAEQFATPLGLVSVDPAAHANLASLPQVIRSDAAHAREHSLEVQLPFLQKILGDFTLVPLVVGFASAEEVAQVLERLWGGPETLIVVSSDLSHYLPYAEAQQTDRHTAQMILQLQTGISHDQACGGTPVDGLLLAARRHGLTPELLDLRNSGDTAGDRSRVVGYCSVAFTEQAGGVH